MHIKLLEVNPQIVRSKPTGRVLDSRLNTVEEKVVKVAIQNGERERGREGGKERKES